MLKDEMKKLWEGLSGGMDGIYEKYSQARSARDQQYQNQLDQAKKDYQAQQNAASAQARISAKNAQNTLSAHGLSNSGESLQAQLMNDLVRNDAMNQAADRYGRTVRDLQAEKQSADAQSEGAMLSEMTGLGKDLYALKLEEAKQEQEARASERELDLKEKQYASDHSMEEQKLKLEQDRLAEDRRQFDKEYDEEMKKIIREYQDAIVELENSISRYEAKEAMKEDEGTVPDISALDMYEQILADSKDGLPWWDDSDEQLEEDYRAKVSDNVKKIINDPAIDEDFRKSLEMYARVGGYL